MRTTLDAFFRVTACETRLHGSREKSYSPRRLKHCIDRSSTWKTVADRTIGCFAAAITFFFMIDCDRLYVPSSNA